jgi:DNA-binding IclR family transcriptional regulator
VNLELKSSLSADELARRLGRSDHVTLTVLASLEEEGVVERDADGGYRLSSAAERRHGPALRGLESLR